MRETVFLTAIFVLLGGYIFFFDLPFASERERFLVSPGELAELEEVVIRAQGEERLRVLFAAEQDATLDNPLYRRLSLPGIGNDRLNHSRLREFLSALQGFSLAETSVQRNTISLEDFGLSDPLFELKLAFQNGTSKTLKLGKYNPLLEARYVLLDDSQYLELVKEEVSIKLASLDRIQLREQRIFYPIDGEIVWLSRDGRQQASRLTLEYEDSGWSVNGDLGDERFIRQFINNLIALRASGFVFDHDARDVDYGFSSPLLEISFRAKSDSGSQIRMLTVGNEVRGLPDSSDSMYYVRSDRSAQPYIVRYLELRPLFVSAQALAVIEDLFE